ncbi:MAG: hypothetical protein ACK4NW_02120 [Roseinatronobacter sp.]
MTDIIWKDAPDWIDADLVDDFGLYEITDEAVLFIGHESTGKAFESIEAAKTAAQVDWDNRVHLILKGAA